MQATASGITGTASGLNRVFYSSGTCQMNSPFSNIQNFAFQTCSQQAFLQVPQPQPTWTCGIQVSGNFTCRNGTVLALGPSGTAVSQVGGPTLTSTAPGGFFSSCSTAKGSQVQAGSAQPGSASSLAGVSGTGSVSSSAISSSSSGGSSSSTQTTQNGQTQGLTTSSGAQTQSFGGANGSTGVLISYSGPEGGSATAATAVCAAPVESTRIPVAQQAGCLHGVVVVL